MRHNVTNILERKVSRNSDASCDLDSQSVFWNLHPSEDTCSVSDVLQQRSQALL